mgnify:FL=1|tara:strand:- start:40 stop:246 length:207 start_codon:yes stop_codon:yes gene_type:complete
MTPDAKDTLEVLGATGGASLLTLTQANEVLQSVAYILTISLTLYKLYWSVRRTIEKHNLKKEKTVKGK